MKPVTRRKFLKGAAAAGGAAVISGFPAFLREGLGARPVKWGSIHPTTGPYSTEAFDQLEGVKIAIEDINREGGVVGRPVELLFRDDQFKWDQTTSHALDLLDNHRVNFLAGSMVGPEEIRLNAISRKRGVIYANYPQHILSTPGNAKKMSRLFFTCNLTPYQEAKSLANYIVRNKLGKRWHFLGDDYIWPKMFLEAYKAVAKETRSDFDPREGVSWVPFPASTDYSAHFPRILKRRPDVLFTVNWGDRQVAFVKQAREIGLHEKMRIIISNTEITMPEAAGKGAYTGFFAGAVWYYQLRDRYPKAKEFYDKFFARRKRPPSGYAAAAYELTRLVLDTANEVKTLNNKKVARAIEGKKFQYLKGQSWVRPCDHVCVSQVFVLGGKEASAMRDDWDTFNIVDEVSGEENTRSCAEKGLV